MAITAKELGALKPKVRKYLVTDSTRERGTGRLVIEVRTNGSKAFLFQWFDDGNRRLIQLGLYDPKGRDGITLEQARTAAGGYSKMLQEGLDPRVETERAERERQQQQEAEERTRREAEAEERARREAGSLGDLLDAYCAALDAAGRSSVAGVRNSLRCYVREPWPGLCSRPAREITAQDVHAVLAAMITKGITTHVNRVRSYLRAAFERAVSCALSLSPEHLTAGVDFARFRVTLNPVAGIKPVEAFERARERALSDAEVRTVWLRLPEVADPATAALVRLLFATGGQRPSAVLRCGWQHYDTAAGWLHMPAEFTKIRTRPHDVPLGPLALDILKDMATINGDAHPFATARSRGKAVTVTSVDRALRKLCAKSGMEPFELRDVRRTCKTLLAGLRVEKEVRDRLQDHVFSDVAGRHYDRFDYAAPKTAAVATLNRRLREIIEGRDNVVMLAARTGAGRTS